jgi:hypothetical protein
VSRARRLAAGAALLVLMAAGCRPPEALPGGRPVPTSGPRTVPYALYTHCEVSELSFEDQWYVREDGPLAADGWDQPYQDGTLTVSDDAAVFEDDEGHREVFVLEADPTTPLYGCS